MGAGKRVWLILTSTANNTELHTGTLFTPSGNTIISDAINIITPALPRCISHSMALPAHQPQSLSEHLSREQRLDIQNQLAIKRKK